MLSPSRFSRDGRSTSTLRFFASSRPNRDSAQNDRRLKSRRSASLTVSGDAPGPWGGVRLAPPPMAELEFSVEIAAPPDRVFVFFVPQRMPYWYGTEMESQFEVQDGAAEFQVGLKVRITGRLGRKEVSHRSEEHTSE